MHNPPLETAIEYAETITSPWGIDTEKLKAGANDLLGRLQVLEAWHKEMTSPPKEPMP